MRCYRQLSRAKEQRSRRHPKNVRQRKHFCQTTIPDCDSLYSYFEDREMADIYRITPHGPEFMVSQNAGVTVGVYNTEQEAQLTVEDCERDDFMLQTARRLVNVAVEAHMRLHHIDRGGRTIGLEKRRISRWFRST